MKLEIIITNIQHLHYKQLKIKYITIIKEKKSDVIKFLTWPVFRNLDSIHPFTASSMSADSNTINGAFPPNSIDTRLHVRAHCSINSYSTTIMSFIIMSRYMLHTCKLNVTKIETFLTIASQLRI